MGRDQGWESGTKYPSKTEKKVLHSRDSFRKHTWFDTFRSTLGRSGMPPAVGEDPCAASEHISLLGVECATSKGQHGSYETPASLCTGIVRHIIRTTTTNSDISLSPSAERYDRRELTSSTQILVVQVDFMSHRLKPMLSSQTHAKPPTWCTKNRTI